MYSSIIKLKPSLVKQVNDYTEGVLHIAIKQKQYLLIHIICKMFPNVVNDSDFFGDTPLHSLAYSFQSEEPDKLIEMYALLSKYSNQSKNQFGMTPNFIRAIWDLEYRKANQQSIPQDLWFNSPDYYFDQDIKSVSSDSDRSSHTDEDC